MQTSTLRFILIVLIQSVCFLFHRFINLVVNNYIIYYLSVQVFKPPCPWTMGLMNLLAELHAEADLKLNLKFEIEVLCKHLQLEISELRPGNALKDYQRLEKLLCFKVTISFNWGPFSYRLTQPQCQASSQKGAQSQCQASLKVTQPQRWARFQR